MLPDVSVSPGPALQESWSEWWKPLNWTIFCCVVLWLTSCCDPLFVFYSSFIVGHTRAHTHTHTHTHKRIDVIQTLPVDSCTNTQLEVHGERERVCVCVYACVFVSAGCTVKVLDPYFDAISSVCLFITLLLSLWGLLLLSVCVVVCVCVCVCAFVVVCGGGGESHLPNKT